MSRCTHDNESKSGKKNTFVKLKNIPVNKLIEHENFLIETAQNVFDCATQAHSKVCTIHGPASEQKKKEFYPHVHSRATGNLFPNELQSCLQPDIAERYICNLKAGIEVTESPTGIMGNNFYIDKKKVIHINPGEDGISLIFSGLQGNTVIIHSKVNHVLIRKCENVRLDIKEGTVSGVDILYCKRMFVIMPYHNFTNLEYGEGIYFQAEINEISQLHFTGSLDVKVNGISVPINPFINAMFGKDGWCYKKQSEIPKLMICRY